MRKLALFDVDGTIISNGQIPDSVIDGMIHLQKLGYITTISSGRCYRRLMQDIEPIADKIISKDALLILEHGTKITDFDGNVVFAEYFQPDDIEHIVDFIRANSGIISYVMTSTPDPKKKLLALCLDEADLPAVLDYRGSYSKVKHVSMGELREILLSDDFSWIMNRLKPHVKVENLQLKLTKSPTILNFQDGNMDFTKNNTNKGIAISYLKNHFAIGSDDILVAGNAINDKEMFNEDSSVRILVGPESERDIIKGYIYSPEGIIEVNTPSDLGIYLQSLTA